MERYLINYLREHATTPEARRCVEYLKVELDWYIYNYGEHVSATHRRGRGSNWAIKRSMLFQFLASRLPLKLTDKNVLSSLANPTFINAISQIGLNPLTSILQQSSRRQVIGDDETARMIAYKRLAIKNGTFNDLYNDTFFEQIMSCRDRLIKQYKAFDFKALFLYTDQYFESKLLIDVFKELGVPSFDFLHGLPGIYTLDADSTTDYLMVWGEKIKENYIKVGFDPNKILVVGNSKYDRIKKVSSLRNTLDDVLVIPCSSLLWHQHCWDEPQLVDRSMIILYLYQIQNVLQQLGVKHARFRPHPSIDSQWVYGFLDNSFYSIDKEHLLLSLNHSSIVIGATSTVFLEAVMCGVNYVVYEPMEERKSLMRTVPVPPFDGADKKVPVAKSEDELKYLLLEKCPVDSSILDDYMQPFDLSVLKGII